MLAEPDKPDDRQQDYHQAKPMIDSLEILKEKTRGNLTAEETTLLDSLLFDLRLRYLKAGARPAGETAVSPGQAGSDKPGQ